ncbi:hypothetical protein I0P70_03650 [Pontibacter sp. FD36]|uniref:Uncharacterized protein n=1 Tax=Pontibacter lucknowensis TaxID=1077936 RepID=A0A1N6WTD5_9BACT|nr:MULTISPECIES: hypothetical protein [Pontibacter]EJF09844.1 hypothetical protein O71_12665 [Pontibacter sp. BAB1700]MBF8962332.1 hypothetical protein [Pontibacter sp. FD36]SIQ93359.1 hypothetical protein SAMN05421545_1743 [Pontibacter lucknowensis]
MAISFDNLRRGKKYVLENYGERFEFQVLDMPEEGAYRVKDLHTLEVFMLHDLIRYGRGKDFDMQEL